jgi:GT2 family glycosyltransferase
LLIDGIVYERLSAACDGERELAFSPTGNTDIAVSLRDEHDIELAATWRIRIGESTSVGVDAWSGDMHAMRAISRPSIPRGVDRPVVVVVPIFNAAALAERCIEAVLRWTSAPARLNLIDDASTESDVARVLARYESRGGISIIHNTSNLGYTRSSNLGIAAAGDADVVLLNSDTQVGPRWLDRFRAIAYGDESIGTVTAVSDNAGAFTVPELERYCPIPAAWTLEQTQRALLQRTACPHPELPTGNGFCMFIKRAMLDAVGALDADAFPSGYGEENDLCQRAERAGFRHVIAGDVFVAHARSASFGDARRAALGAQGMNVLRQRYPDYEEKVGAILFSFERRVLDYRVRRIYADSDNVYASQPPLPRVLMVGQGEPLDGFDTFRADANSIFCCVDSAWQPVGDIDSASLVDHAIELIAVMDARDADRWRALGASASVPVTMGSPTATWNSLAAFGSVVAP